MPLSLARSLLWSITAICILWSSCISNAVTVNLTALYLRTANGDLMPTNGLVVLVASTNDSSFSGPTPTSFVSDDDIVIASWDLSNTPIGDGVLQDEISNVTFADRPGWASGDSLAMYWFPTLTLTNSEPGNNTPYGFYTDPVGLDNSAPWITPSESSTLNLWFQTSDSPLGGSNPASAGIASLTVGSANQPPVAVDDTFTRHPDFMLTIPVATLLANDSDPDSDPLILQGFSAITTNGVPLTGDGTNIYYPATNSPAVNVTDGFSYTNSDGLGGTATGFVVINVNTNPIFGDTTGPIVVNSSNVSVQLYGLPGFSYGIQRATNVTFTSGVTNIHPIMADTNGAVNVMDDFSDLDSTPPTPNQAFYRLYYTP